MFSLSILHTDGFKDSRRVTWLLGQAPSHQLLLCTHIHDSCLIFFFFVAALTWPAYERVGHLLH